MKILLTCDDGVYSVGIAAMCRELGRLGQVYVAAPAGQRSAVSHGITLYHPLIPHLKKMAGAKACYSVNGTPADCVKLALTSLLGFRPDIIVSGINKGLNTGSNILYSGTVGAAFEGSLFNITSFAVSMEEALEKGVRAGARIAARIIRDIYRDYRRTNVVFNINIPAASVSRYKGCVWTRHEQLTLGDKYEKRVDPRGRTYYWLHSDNPAVVISKVSKRGIEDFISDVTAIHRGYVSVTPLERDLTNYEVLREHNSEHGNGPAKRGG